MQILNAALLREIREMKCAWCGRWPPNDANHIVRKGTGGGRQIDHRMNLVPLCRICHDDFHAGRQPIEDDLVALIAAREKCSQDDVRDAHRLFRRER